MANHSIIRLSRAATIEDVESAFSKINDRRFDGRLVLTSDQDLTESWEARRAWVAEAPGTCPDPLPRGEPDEDLGFLFWLHEDGRAIESRHANGGPWISWVQHIFEHELARHFDERKFDGGDGDLDTNPEQFKDNFYDWITRNFEAPLSAENAKYIDENFVCRIPNGWT